MDTTNRYAGFFGNIHGGRVSDLLLEGRVYSHDNDSANGVGGFAGEIQAKSLVDGCSFTGQVDTGDTGKVGGFVGTTEDSPVILRSGGVGQDRHLLVLRLRLRPNADKMGRRIRRQRRWLRHGFLLRRNQGRTAGPRHSRTRQFRPLHRDRGRRRHVGPELPPQPRLRHHMGNRRTHRHARLPPRQAARHLRPNGAPGVIAPHAYDIGTDYDFPPPPTWSGHAFLGWFDAKDGGYPIPSDSRVTTDTARTFYAHWTDEQTVFFDANGGRCDFPSATYDFDIPYGVLPAATLDGMALLGWFDGDERVTPDTIVPVEATRTLVAHWAPPQTVTFDVNGGGTCPVTMLVCPIGGIYDGFEPVVWANHVFRGWYADDEDGSRVKNGDRPVPDVPERNLTAHWREGASTLAITAFEMTPRAASPAARSAAPATVECTLWFGTVAGTVYEVLWTASMDGEWTLLKRWTAEEDGKMPVTVETPADAVSGFFRLIQPDAE